MAVETDTDDLRRSLWRSYPNHVPSYRRACVIEFAPDTADKYMLSRVNDYVADTAFLAQIHTVMTAPVTPREHETMSDGTIVDGFGDPIVPGSPDHFRIAVSSIPTALDLPADREVL
jgi:hypothetical protein